MRVAMLSVVVLASSFRVCSSSEDAPPPPAAAPPAMVEVEAVAELPTVTAEVAVPRHAGTVVVAQDHAVEVVAQPDGLVTAWVVDVQGQPAPSAELTVHIHGDDGHAHPVVLVYDADVGYYRGNLVEVHPAPGPVQVALVVGGRIRTGRVATYVVAPVPAAHVEIVGAAPHGHIEVGVPAPRIDVDVSIGLGGRVQGGGGVVVRSPGVVVERRDGHRGRGRGHVIGRGRGHSMH